MVQAASGLTVRRALIRGVEQGIAVDRRATVVSSLIEAAVIGVIVQGGRADLSLRQNRITATGPGDAAVGLYANAGATSGATVENNLLAGGQYTLWAGGQGSRDLRVTGNRFSRSVAPEGGVHGPVTMFDEGGANNVWSGNTWADAAGNDTGRAVGP